MDHHFDVGTHCRSFTWMICPLKSATTPSMLPFALIVTFHPVPKWTSQHLGLLKAEVAPRDGSMLSFFDFKKGDARKKRRVTYAESITKNRQTNMGQKQWQLHLATDVATSRCWKMPSTPAPSPSPRRTFGKPALPGARDAWGGMLRETFEVQGQMNFWVFADNSWSVWARYCVDCTKRTSLQCHWQWWLVGITMPQQKVTVNCWLHPRNDSQLLIPQVIAGEKGFLATTCPSWMVPTRTKSKDNSHPSNQESARVCSSHFQTHPNTPHRSL